MHNQIILANDDNNPLDYYNIINNELFHCDINSNKLSLGSVLNAENIQNYETEQWWLNIENNLTKNILLEFILNIDNKVITLSKNEPNITSYSLSYDVFNTLYDNNFYCNKFNKNINKFLENKINFIKNMFTRNGLNIDIILNMKFPNCIIEFKQNIILITIA